MPDHDGPEPRDPRVPGELFRSTATDPPPSIDLTRALGDLDRATRSFTRRFNGAPVVAERPRPATDGVRSRGPAAVTPADSAPNADPARPNPAAAAERTGGSSFDLSMREAEREAREYLESAKRRADSLVASMVGAVEHEAAEIRRGAEAGIRARWEQVEVDANRHVENARRVAAQMVAERQSRIAALSDGISDRAVALTAGMEDADRVRAQFDAFVRALSKTADQIAGASAPREDSGQLHALRERPRPSAIAA